MSRAVGLHVGLILLLLAMNFVLPAYHHGNLARIMVLAVYAMSYNIMFGYTGLLSLGHAMFFTAGMYGMGLSMRLWDMPVGGAFLVGIVAAAGFSLVVGLLALRTIGVAFMIVTLMFSQAVFLTILYFNPITRGDEGFVIPQAARQIAGIDLSDANNRYLAAWMLFSVCLLAVLALVRSRVGRVLIAIRENEERARMLGYDTWAHKLAAVVMSGTMAGAAGAAYGALFGSVGASFAEVPFSILPLLYVLLGGPGTVIGPFVGTFFMFYLRDLSGTLTDAHMLVAGLVLIGLTLFARRGIMGLVRERWAKWLP
ncbi:MAG: branched-chain amino acid ABC transporter permease [Rhodobacterales bacterium]|jgi:branched-chain amino acid transport system permease protein|nr:branched-chain amino acid ABC transporter permease [Pseudomonadota bacterium]MDA1286074.1 branched-chain amino acid ABC transporter permease [Pseudomonadota bacterium]NQW15264.1 branched-chain amino acid ABC transporter permease [Rhodobacter sp.]